MNLYFKFLSIEGNMRVTPPILGYLLMAARNMLKRRKPRVNYMENDHQVSMETNFKDAFARSYSGQDFTGCEFVAVVHDEDRIHSARVTFAFNDSGEHALYQLVDHIVENAAIWRI